MKLDVHNNLKIETKAEIIKQHEFKYIGSSRHRKGLTMYAFDIENRQIYVVEITKKVIFDITKKKEIAHLKAVLRPKHLHIYALNLKNAIRKFTRMLKQRNLDHKILENVTLKLQK